MQIVKTGLCSVLLRVFDRWDRYEGRMRLKICAHILQTLQHLCNISTYFIIKCFIQDLSIYGDLVFSANVLHRIQMGFQAWLDLLQLYDAIALFNFLNLLSVILTDFSEHISEAGRRALCTKKHVQTLHRFCSQCPDEPEFDGLLARVCSVITLCLKHQALPVPVSSPASFNLNPILKGKMT